MATRKRTDLDWKVYNGQKEYVAACAHATDAACLVGTYGKGATVRFVHSWTVWRQGEEAFDAAESWDGAADVMEARVAERQQQVLERKRRAQEASRVAFAQRQAERAARAVASGLVQVDCALYQNDDCDPIHDTLDGACPTVCGKRMAALRAECGEPVPCASMEEGCRKLVAGEAKAVSFVVPQVSR
jgi:hypothetical protein